MIELRLKFPVKLISSVINMVNIEYLDDKYQFNNDFDFTPIFSNNRYIGFIRKNNYNFTDSIKSVLEPQTDNIINSDCEISDALVILMEYSFAILIDQNGIYSILTLSDLTKQPFRLYLFSLLSDFEVTITDIIRSKQLDLKEYLSEEKYGVIQDRFERNKLNNSYIDVYQELDFIHKLEIITKSDISNSLILSKKEFKKFRSKLNSLRNDIAHSREIHFDIKEILYLINTMKSIFTEFQTGSITVAAKKCHLIS